MRPCMLAFIHEAHEVDEDGCATQGRQAGGERVLFFFCFFLQAFDRSKVLLAP